MARSSPVRHRAKRVYDVFPLSTPVIAPASKRSREDRKMNVGKLALRGVIGPLFVGHGTQKLFGWFGGHGLEGTAGFFEQGIGLRPGKRHATAAGLSEAVGGALLTAGALTPLASSMIIGA